MRMKDKLRELAGTLRRGDCNDAECLSIANEINRILDAEGDGGAVDSMRALLSKALMNYRCNRTVDEDGEPLPLVDVLSPGEGGTIQPGIEEIEFLAECLADELPTLHTHPARSGVVSDEDVSVVAKMIADRVGNGMREKYEDVARQIVEHLSTHPHSPDAADSGPVDVLAREMLAREFERGHPATHYPEYARIARKSQDVPTMAAILAISAALAAQDQGEAVAPFIIGNAYRTKAGELVRFVSIHNEGTSYETMADESGVHRYTRRDFGRVTGTAHDYSDPCNTPPLYTAPPAGVPDGWALVPTDDDAQEQMLRVLKQGRPTGGYDGERDFYVQWLKEIFAAAPSAPEGGGHA